MKKKWKISLFWDHFTGERGAEGKPPVAWHGEQQRGEEQPPGSTGIGWFLCVFWDPGRSTAHETDIAFTQLYYTLWEMRGLISF